MPTEHTLRMAAMRHQALSMLSQLSFRVVSAINAGHVPIEENKEDNLVILRSLIIETAERISGDE